MIGRDGWALNDTWQHSSSLAELYERRCTGEAEEMTAHAQAAELLASLAVTGDSLLDVGCGAGQFFRSIRNRNIPVTYNGIDAAARLTSIGRRVLPAFGLPEERLQTLRIEDLSGSFDHVVCLNVITYLDNFYRPLDRLLSLAGKSLILRESLKTGSEYSYVVDACLDQPMPVHINSYDLETVLSFIRERGFTAQLAIDRRTEGKQEIFLGVAHHWKFLTATRDGEKPCPESAE
jgi:ubiquinone/menaquinone biosynthesis C-methylase UbiE